MSRRKIVRRGCHPAAGRSTSGRRDDPTVKVPRGVPEYRQDDSQAEKQGRHSDKEQKRHHGGKAEHRSPFCKPCHKQVHATYSNAELARQFKTVADLRSAGELQPFLQWITRQRPDRNFRTAVSKRKRR